ncbi:hypothetical protein [Malacoplasma muris]|uniref:hypothetical protein n=1 Tax=Malacoplasma muris TaxID=2119 RepID=UPI00398E7001
MNNKRSSNSLNKLFLILSMVWVGVALLSTLLFLGASLVTKDLLNIIRNDGTTDMLKNLGLSTSYGTSSASLSGIGIAAVFFLVIALISSIVLIVLYSKFQPNFISKTYFYWTIGITLFVLIFTTIIAFLGSPWNIDEAKAMADFTTGKKPIIANMITVNINNSTQEREFSLGGGAISILLVDIVFVCGIIVSIANLIARYVKANKNVENLFEINIDQLNLQ